jgi:hypothetical protein
MVGALFKEQPISIPTHEQTGMYCRRGDACSGDAHAKGSLTEQIGRLIESYVNLAWHPAVSPRHAGSVEIVQENASLCYPSAKI